MESLTTPTNPPPKQACEVLVIGGGPAGTTVACGLKKLGHDVVLIEKDQHPRFHIGESLLPMNLPILERLNVLEDVIDIGIHKNGAEFVSTTNQSHTFYFKDAMNKEAPGYAYQVKRSEFDLILLNNCKQSGVTVHEQHKVTSVETLPDHVDIGVSDSAGNNLRYSADFVVDASGRNSYLARKLNIKEKNRRHNSAAVFGHFKGVQRRTGDDAGNITVCWFDQGWFWMIPLNDGLMSVGAVCNPAYLKSRKKSLQAFFWDTVERCPAVKQRMRSVDQVGDINATGNFSYSARRSYGNRYLLVGDAFAFVDPVFSSGVFLAMSSAEFAADTIHQFLAKPDQGATLFKNYEKKVRAGIKTVSWFIYRFNTPAMRRLFIHPRNTWRIEEAVISMLAGDIYGDSPIRSRISIFKFIYYSASLKMLPKSLLSYRRRRKNVSDQFDGGTLDVDQ